MDFNHAWYLEHEKEIWIQSKGSKSGFQSKFKPRSQSKSKPRIQQPDSKLAFKSNLGIQSKSTSESNPGIQQSESKLVH